MFLQKCFSKLNISKTVRPLLAALSVNVAERRHESSSKNRLIAIYLILSLSVREIYSFPTDSKISTHIRGIKYHFSKVTRSTSVIKYHF